MTASINIAGIQALATQAGARWEPLRSTRWNKLPGWEGILVTADRLDQARSFAQTLVVGWGFVSGEVTGAAGWKFEYINTQGSEPIVVILHYSPAVGERGCGYQLYVRNNPGVPWLLYSHTVITSPPTESNSTLMRQALASFSESNVLVRPVLAG